MEEIKDSLNIALEIINTLLQNKEIKKSENTELYQQYVGNDEVESLCDMILCLDRKSTRLNSSH